MILCLVIIPCLLFEEAFTNWVEQYGGNIKKPSWNIANAKVKLVNQHIEHKSGYCFYHCGRLRYNLVFVGSLLLSAEQSRI